MKKVYYSHEIKEYFSSLPPRSTWGFLIIFFMLGLVEFRYIGFILLTAYGLLFFVTLVWHLLNTHRFPPKFLFAEIDPEQLGAVVTFGFLILWVLLFAISFFFSVSQELVADLNIAWFIILFSLALPHGYMIELLAFYISDKITGMKGISYGVFTDPRDGQKYKTVKLKDGKVWMAQNLSFPIDIGKECWAYRGDLGYTKQYGLLYTWEAAQKACPPGWHIPSDDEWWEMAKHYGMAEYYGAGEKKNSDADAGKAVYKSLRKGGSSGFNALLGGGRGSTYGEFEYLGSEGNYWSSTTHRKNSNAWYYSFYRYSKSLRRYDKDKSWGFSCRCVQDKVEYGVFTDPRDGQKYKTVKLKDGKVWMAQNLNFDVGKESWYHEDIESSEYKKHGRLYTWEAAQRACPPGWHIPSDDEWWEMIKEYGMAWNNYEGQKENKYDGAVKAAYKSLLKGGYSGFSALLGGYRYTHGDFYSLGDYGLYWSSTEQSSSAAWGYRFGSNNKRLRRYYYGKSWGFSCRCVQD